MILVSYIRITCQTISNFNLHPEFCRRDTDEGSDKDFEKVIKDLAKAPGAPSVTKMKLQFRELFLLQENKKDEDQGKYVTFSTIIHKEAGEV